MSTWGASRPRLNRALWLVQGLLAFLFAASGVWKLTAEPASLLADGMTWVARFPPGFSRFVGFVELLGGVGVITPSLTRVAPVLAPAAAAGLALTMAVAAGDHLLAGEYAVTPPSVVLGLLSAFVTWGRGVAAPIGGRAA